MFRFFNAGRRAQPDLGEAECHSLQEIPFAVSQAVSSFQTVIESPSVAARFFDEGCVFLPMNAFGKSTLTFFLDFTDECTPGE
jgi:hypothetical protein